MAKTLNELVSELLNYVLMMVFILMAKKLFSKVLIVTLSGPKPVAV